MGAVGFSEPESTEPYAPFWDELELAELDEVWPRGLAGQEDQATLDEIEASDGERRPFEPTASPSRDETTARVIELTYGPFRSMSLCARHRRPRGRCARSCWSSSSRAASNATAPISSQKSLSLTIGLTILRLKLGGS
jgi:hypothetical protein